MPEIELMLDCRAIIGESPTWFAPEQALYWIDVKAPALHRLSADGVAGAMAPRRGYRRIRVLESAAGATVALRNGIFRLDFATGKNRASRPASVRPESLPL